MLKRRLFASLVGVIALAVVTCSESADAWAEAYVAGQVGGVFPERLSHVIGTEQNSGLRLSDLELKSSFTGGLKAGYFLPRSLSWLGAEIDAFYTSPHLRQQDVVATQNGASSLMNIGGAHLRVATWAVNLLVRYPGERVQPYLGIGLGIYSARISGNGNGPGTASDSSPGMNLIGGVRYFVTPQIGLFAEYKYNRTTFDFGGGGDNGENPVFLRTNYVAHLVVIGASYHFGSGFLPNLGYRRPTVAEKQIKLAEEALAEPTTKEEHVLKALPAKGEYTIIPLPAYSYNRNEGSWIGVLVPILHANANGEIEDIIAPMYLHNDIIKEDFTLNYYGYRQDTIQFHAIGSYATKVERTIDLSYRDLAAGDGQFIFGADVMWFKNAFARFFGIGNRTNEQRETNYTSREAVAKVTAGINLLPNMSLLLTERYHDVRVEDGIISSLPQTKQVFGDTPGIQGAQILGHGLTFLYDSRDSVLTPLRGAYFNMLAEFDQDLKPSQPNHWWRLTLDARKLLPHASDRMVFVGRFLIDSVLGQNDNDIPALRQGVPFYERPTLGGETTLRGFGRSRFISNVAILVNLEERIQVLKQRIFDYVIELEVAPFLDMGRVARNFTADRNFLQHLQVNPGAGVRLIARPNVVGRLDIGFGRDGETVFVGLDYPF